jgi:phosphoglycerate dehydrogenase-like enzyme
MKIVTSVFSDPAWTLPPGEVDRLRLQFPHLAIVDAPSRAARVLELPAADVAFLSQLTPDEFAVAGRLRWIQSPAAGVAALLFPALRQSDVILTNARGIHGDAMAEHVIGVLIVLFRQLHRALRHQAAHTWAKEPLSSFRMLRGQRMAVVGLGAVGSAVAARAAAMGMEVVGVRRRVGPPSPPGVSAVYPAADLERVLADADVVVLAAPLTDGTRWLIGAEQLGRMKPDAVLVNIARGKLVCEDALAEALSAGAIGGAALDVFEHEPLDASSPLWDAPNVVITPHTAAFRGDYWALAADLFAANLRRFERGEVLANVVDKAAGY